MIVAEDTPAKRDKKLMASVAKNSVTKIKSPAKNELQNSPKMYRSALFTEIIVPYS